MEQQNTLFTVLKTEISLTEKEKRALSKSKRTELWNNHDKQEVTLSGKYIISSTFCECLVKYCSEMGKIFETAYIYLSLKNTILLPKETDTNMLRTVNIQKIRLKKIENSC